MTTLTQIVLAYMYLQLVQLLLSHVGLFYCVNILEATLPSLISKQVNPNSKGTAMGIYSTSQFWDFLPAAPCRCFIQWSSSQGIFITNAVLGTLWLLVSFSMKPNVYISTLILPYPWPERKETVLAQLLNINGVVELVLAEEERVLYLRINKEHYIDGSAERILTPP